MESDNGFCLSNTRLSNTKQGTECSVNGSALSPAFCLSDKLPLRFGITGNKKPDNREIEIFFNCNNKEQFLETLKFIKKYLKIEKTKTFRGEID